MIFKQFDDVCIPIPRTLTDCIVLIKSDMYRYCGYSSRSKIWREVLINPSFAFVFWLRLSSVQWIGYPVAKMIKTLIGRKKRVANFRTYPYWIWILYCSCFWYYN